MERTFLLNEYEMILSEHILMQDIVQFDNMNQAQHLQSHADFSCRCRKTCKKPSCTNAAGTNETRSSND